MKSQYKSAFLKYLVLNSTLLLIAEVIILTLLFAEAKDITVWLLRLQAVGLLILAAQYPLLVRFQNWAVRFALFVTGMFVGLALVGIISVDGRSSQMATGAFLTAFIGFILGFFPCIVIVLINWLFEKHLYPPKPSDI